MEAPASQIPVWTQPWVMRRSRGFPYGVGLVKNRYIGCTFITPDQRSREQAVRIKLGALRSCVEGRRG